MALSGWYSFDNTTDGGGLWSSRGNVRYDNTTYATDVLSPGYYSWLKMYNWKGPSISTSATINELYIRIRGYVNTSATYDSATDNVRLLGAFYYAGSTLYYVSYMPSGTPPYLAEGTATTYSVNKNLSSWGITEAQAFDVINSTEPMCIGASVNASHSDAETIRIEYAEMQVDYTPPPGNAGMLIGNPGA